MGIMSTRLVHVVFFVVNYGNNIFSVIYESRLLHTVLHTILSVFFSCVFSQCLIVYQYSSSATVFLISGHNNLANLVIQLVSNVNCFALFAIFILCREQKTSHPASWKNPSVRPHGARPIPN